MTTFEKNKINEQTKNQEDMKSKSLFSLLLAVMIAIPAMAQDAKLTKENASMYYAEFKKIFTDGSCSELAVPYSAMTDQQLKDALWDIPQELIDIALKVKNNSWERREKEFRVAEYEPHNNVYRWGNILKTYQYASLQRPTGITATTGDTLLIFIDDNLLQGTFLRLQEVVKNDPYTDWNVVDAEKYLVKGLNVVTVSQPDAMLFINYSVTTDSAATSTKLSDYPIAKIHIEGGNVNGYFDASRHTDEDWRDMMQNYFKHYSVQVKGEKVIFHMELANIRKVCPNKITDAIGWWDQCLKWQHELMGADKYYDRFNSLLMARDGYEGMYMYATSNYTYYEYNTLADILPWATVYENPGKMWGPAHEIGHINQGAINIVSCTESSNNLFSNVQIHRTGKTTTRGAGVAYCMDEFYNRKPFPLRGDAIGKSRMFFQLYLYFHAAGKMPDFYPRLFDALRSDPLSKGYNTDAKNDQLKFAEKCCEIAQMDLSEFFDAWGFFEPMQNANIDDYATYIVTLTEEDAEASRARMQKYSKKGGHLMFIEDRIKPSKREDGVYGNRLDFNDEFVIGKMGETGQWGDYIDESVKAEGYYYLVKNNAVQIRTSENSKGALGFKLYDAETGKLLSFSNTYSMKIPTSAQSRELRVVAAQADGTDYEIPNIMDSEDESMQKDVLDALISSIMKYVVYTTSNGNNIGYYYTDAVKELKALYNDAKKALKNNDTSVHSYAEWCSLLREALEVVKNNPNAQSKIMELDVYEMTNIKHRGYYLCNDRMGMKGIYNTSSLEDRKAIQWLVESAGEPDMFYIKDKDGNYINDVTLNLGAMCSGTDKSNAVVFRVSYYDDGTLSFTTADSGMYLALDNEYKIVGANNLNDNVLWLVTRVEKNSTAIGSVSEEEKDGAVYDLQGRRINTPRKGIYIKNGKKFLNK